MAELPRSLLDLVERAKGHPPIRVAAVAAAHHIVLETMREAQSLGLIEPILVGASQAIQQLTEELDWRITDASIMQADGEAAAAASAVRLVREGQADAVMKGHLHTDTLMHALLDSQKGLRTPGRRVSHVFVTDIPTYHKLLHITDAAINIAPDLNAKAQIVENAVELARLTGARKPKVAALSAVETVSPAIASSVDAACLSLMARRAQIDGALVDGPLAFDNAISAEAAHIKGIDSDVAGDADIVLVPDLVSGNILAKNLEYLAGASAAGIVMGLSVPVLLSSRADPPAGRLAALAVAVLMRAAHPRAPAEAHADQKESTFHCAPQPESACCPISS